MRATRASADPGFIRSCRQKRYISSQKTEVTGLAVRGQNLAAARPAAGKNPMHAEQEAAAYFLATHALKSSDPNVRRAGISTLIELAQRAGTCVRARASAILTKEFGPYALADGLSGCTARISTVHQCDAEGWDCRACEWLWNPRENADSARTHDELDIGPQCAQTGRAVARDLRDGH
jgi:hypothetical protein